MNSMLRFFSIITVLALFMVGVSGLMPFFGDVAAQEDNLKWDESEDDWGSDEDAVTSGNFNIFLKTDKLMYKIVFFVFWVVILYILTWFVFSVLIKQNSAPSKAFMVSFPVFMLLVYVGVFFGFSEYFLDQTYDRSVTYWRQLNWTPILIGLLTWVPVSIGLTYVFKGK